MTFKVHRGGKVSWHNLEQTQTRKPCAVLIGITSGQVLGEPATHLDYTIKDAIMLPRGPPDRSLEVLDAPCPDSTMLLSMPQPQQNPSTCCISSTHCSLLISSIVSIGTIP